MNAEDVHAAGAELHRAVDKFTELLAAAVTSAEYWRNRAEQAEEALDETNGAPPPDEDTVPAATPAPIDVFNGILAESGEPPTTIEELERYGIRLDRAHSLAEVWGAIAPRVTRARTFEDVWAADPFGDNDGHSRAVGS